MTQPASNWADKITVIKGTMAEQIIDKYLEGLGFVVYRPKTGGPHAFDNLAIRDKQEVIIAESKAKARRNKYPDTGINLKHYHEYKSISGKHKIPVFLFFVDEMVGAIYGNYLHKLEQPVIVNGKQYPSIEGNETKIIYFPLINMETVQELTPNEVQFLRQYTSRKHEYGKNIMV